MEDFKKKRSFEGKKPSFGSRKTYGPHKSSNDRRQNDERRSLRNDDRESSASRTHGSSRRPVASHDRPFGERHGNGGHPHGGPRKPFGSAKTGRPRKKTDGIERMINRKPLASVLPAPENVDIVVKDEVRLNKFIANSGICSRREADTMIQAGVVTVNGEVVTELGTKINIFKDEVRFNGELLRGESKVYIVMNKPKGYVTTTSDPHADKTVMDLLKNCQSRVFPVGRLDKATTGVLMFTNDGDVAEQLAHPSYDKKKIYQVTLDRNLSQEDYERIKTGVELADGFIAADELEYVDDANHKKLGIEIHSGKNRIVRRIFEHLGYDVKALDRVYFAGLTKRGLKRGEWRFLTENESNILKMGAYI